MIKKINNPKNKKRKYFGTDGIRGRANTYPMTGETALKVGMAAGEYFTRGKHKHNVVIGKDTRLSGYLIEPSLTNKSFHGLAADPKSIFGSVASTFIPTGIIDPLTKILPVN